jgi:parallel beta-helix repeat protein
VVRKKVVTAIVLTVLAISMLTLIFNSHLAEASATIYIRTDGSIDPPTASITTTDNVTYTFTGNINASIVVERNNTVIDGAGYTLQGTGNGNGFGLTDADNVTIKEVSIKNFANGIHLYNSHGNTIFKNNITNNEKSGVTLWIFSNNNTVLGNNIDNNGDFGIFLWVSCYNNTLSGNNVTNNAWGICLRSVSNTVLRNNSMSGNYWNFGFNPHELSNFMNDVDPSNTVDGKPIYYWINHQNEQVPSDAGYVALVNCNNATVKGLELKNNGQGIIIANTTNSRIEYNNLTSNNEDGIGIWYSSSNTAYGNRITNSYCGIRLQLSSNTLLRNNTIAANSHDFIVWGTELLHFIHNIDVSNTADGKPIYYLINQNNLIINSSTHPDIGYLALINSTKATVEGLKLEDKWQGILLASTNGTTITRNNITNNDYGIDVYFSTNNTISENKIINNVRGILLQSAFDNTVTQNKITDNSWGLILSDSSSNIIRLNDVANNGFSGFHISDSSNNRIYNNNLTGNQCGIWITASSNRIYHNNFVNNTEQVWSSGPTNSWTDGYPSGGNYWSDFIGVDVKTGPSQDQLGSDGIGDTPYVIDANNADNYPLMQPCRGPVRNLNTGQSYPTIQEAVNYASEGDAILALSGTYSENVVVNKTVSLIGESKSNTIVDGNGTGSVITITANNVNFTNFTIQNGSDNHPYAGIYMYFSSGNNISNNVVTNNYYGIRLYSSSNNSISGNNITENKECGIGLYSSSNYNSISGNNITAHNRNSIVLSYSSNSSISGNNITNNGAGIVLSYSSNSSISGNNITNNGAGIVLSYSSNSSISGNNITNNWDGIVLQYSSNYNSISGNNITAHNRHGIVLSYSSNYNSISGNNITNNGDGIGLADSSYNSISGNNITENNEFGIGLYSSSNNRFYHNNFIDNTQQVRIYTTGYANVWDDGYPSGGNYWSDYTGVDLNSGPYQNETGRDAIGDTPYVIDANNTDHYPLMNPWPDTTPPTISILSPQNTTYPTSSVPLTFTTNEPTSWIGYSLDDQANVTITGNTTLTGLAIGPHNVIVYANDTYGNTGSSDKVYFTRIVNDVAILNVTASPTETYVDQIVNINVTVKNKGTVSETFNVTVYYDSIPIDTHSVVNLAPGSNITVTFSWNTSGVQKGTYAISAEAEVVPGETNTTDNTYIDDTVSILNGPPTIDSSTPVDTTPEVNEGDSLEFTHTSSDPDDDALTYSWLLDSVEQSTIRNWTYSPSYNEAGTHNVTLVVSDGELTDSQEWTVTVINVNRPPTAPVADVTPDNPVTTDDLTCTLTTPSTDPDNDTITYVYEWYRDQRAGFILMPDETTVTTALSDTVSSTKTAKGDVWKCIVTPNDGTEDGSSNEDQVTIGNTPPTAPTIDVTPNTPTTTDNLVCNVTISSNDPDEDTITYFYEWYKNEVLQPSLTTDTVPSSETAKGEVWKCIATPFDGTENGTSSEDQVTILNSPPSISNVEITPDPAYTNTDLTATPAGWSDPDNDPPSYSYQWQKWISGNWQNISGATSQTISSSNFAKNDQIKVVCTPFDGTSYGTAKEDAITILDSPPTIDSFTPTDIEPEVNEGDSLEFTHTSSDLDGDPLTYSWLLDSVEQSTSQNWTYSPSYDDAGVHNVTLVVSDGELTDSQQWTVTVMNVNRPPIIDTYYPSTDPTINEGESQEFNVTYHDPDGAAVSVQWYLDGTPTTTDDSYTFASDYDSAGIYNITVVVSDGLAQAFYEWDLTVSNVNRAPTIDSHYPVTNPTIQEGESQEFNITKFDLDGDPLLVTWWLNQSDTGETSDSYTYAANHESAGTYNITVVVSDGLSQTLHQWILTVTDLKRDIAITNMSTSKNIVGQGYTLSVNVTITNQGDLTETFNVTAYCNETALTLPNGKNYTTITLTSGDYTTIIFTWNTTSFAKGNYTVSAYASSVLGETDTSDNLFIDGWVFVAMPGDVNADGIVDIFDCVIVALAFGSKPGDINWNPVADINNDNIVDIFDIVVVALHFGEIG